MCRAVYLRKLNNEEDKNMFALTLNYAVNSYIVGNKDGFFIKFDGGKLRTTDFNRFVAFIRENEQSINKSNEVMLHCRFGTHGKGINCVHGWVLNGFTCYHNGITSIKDLKNENDSFDFFESVTKGKNTFKELKRELNERIGNGAFFMFKTDGTGFICSKNHPINIHLINQNIIAINSNDDIHEEITPKVAFPSKSTVNAWGLAFESTLKSYIDVELSIKEDICTSFEDGILTLGKEGVTKITKLDFYPFNTYGKNGWTKKEKKGNKGYKYPLEYPDYSKEENDLLKREQKMLMSDYYR